MICYFKGKDVALEEKTQEQRICKRNANMCLVAKILFHEQLDPFGLGLHPISHSIIHYCLLFPTTTAYKLQLTPTLVPKFAKLTVFLQRVSVCESAVMVMVAGNGGR